MIDYSKWELRRLKIDSLRLDNENPRLPEEMLHEAQSTIIQFLVNEFNVLELAQSIAKNGFFINEAPIVAKSGKHFIVIEGNRRVTALKLLRNPDLAPARKKHSYSRLAEDIDTGLWERLPVYIAPSREEVAPILVARHGVEMTSPWQRIMKMRFLAGEVLKGISYENISEKYSVKISEIKTAAYTILLREMIRGADINDTDKDIYLSDKFQTSTLTRIVEAKRFSELTGLSLSGSKLQFKIPQNEFLNIIIHICNEISNNTLTHRTHENIEDRNKYIEIIVKMYTTGETGHFDFEAPRQEENIDKKETRNPKPRRKWERLISETMDFNTGLIKLNELLVEGQKMPIGTYPHAGGLLLRTILDLSIQRIYDLHGKIEETKDGEGRTKGLTKRINNMISTHSDWFPDKATYNKLKRFTAKDSESFVHIETLNDYAHGDYGRPTKDDLLNFWKQIEPIIDLLLEDG